MTKTKKKAIGIDGGKIKNRNVLDIALRLAMAKGEDTVIYEVTTLTPLYDYVILTTGTSEKRLKSLTHEAEGALIDNNFDVGHIEGKKESTWFLVDGHEIIIHAFLPQTRKEVNFEAMYEGMPSKMITDEDLEIYSKSNTQQ